MRVMAEGMSARDEQQKRMNLQGLMSMNEQQGYEQSLVWTKEQQPPDLSTTLSLLGLHWHATHAEGSTTSSQRISASRSASHNNRLDRERGAKRARPRKARPQQHLVGSGNL